MKAIFIELPAFEKHRSKYLTDEQFLELQGQLLANPEAGDAIAGTHGVRKIRFADLRRGKGKRGGLRIIYYWWISGAEFWLFTLYDKDETADLTPQERKIIGHRVKTEIAKRSKTHEQT